MGRPTLSNARYRARPSARQYPPRYRGTLLLLRTRAYLAEERRRRLADMQWSEEQLVEIRQAGPGLVTVQDANEAYNRIRASMVDLLSSSGRVHIGSWTRRWYALRRLFNRLCFWIRRHVD